MPKTYTHLSSEERDLLAVLKSKGYSLRDMAKTLQRDPGTLSRELRRNAKPRERFEAKNVLAQFIFGFVFKSEGPLAFHSQKLGREKNFRSSRPGSRVVIFHSLSSHLTAQDIDRQVLLTR